MFQKMLQSGSGGDTIEMLPFIGQKYGGKTPIEIQLTPSIITPPKAVKFAMGVGGENIEYVRISSSASTIVEGVDYNKIP